MIAGCGDNARHSNQAAFLSERESSITDSRHRAVMIKADTGPACGLYLSQPGRRTAAHTLTVSLRLPPTCSRSISHLSLLPPSVFRTFSPSRPSSAGADTVH